MGKTTVALATLTETTTSTGGYAVLLWAEVYDTPRVGVRRAATFVATTSRNFSTGAGIHPKRLSGQSD